MDEGSLRLGLRKAEAVGVGLSESSGDDPPAGSAAAGAPGEKRVQYSSTSVTLRTRVVSAGSAGSGESDSISRS